MTKKKSLKIQLRDILDGIDDPAVRSRYVTERIGVVLKNRKLERKSLKDAGVSAVDLDLYDHDSEVLRQALQSIHDLDARQDYLCRLIFYSHLSGTMPKRELKRLVAQRVGR